MKKLILCLLVPVLLATGCKKWLDVKPKTQVDEGQLLSLENGFEDALYGVYATMAGGSLYGDQLTMSFVDVLAQRYSAQSTPEHDFYQAALYNYQDPGVKARITNIWDSAYFAIANVNNILNHIDGQRSVFQADNYRLVKGEALGLRAFLHFDLLRLFGPSYLSNPGKLSIPYVKTVSGGVTPLGTVSAVLDSVIADLTLADSLLGAYKNILPPFNNITPLQNDWLNNRQYHFNYWAAEALLARVYLYKGNKQQALLHATAVINSGMFTFITSAAITNLHDRTFTPEQVFSVSKYNLLPQVSNYFLAAGTAGSNLGTNTHLTNTYGNGGVVDKVFETASGGATDFRYAFLWAASNNIYFPAKFWQDAGQFSHLNNLVPLIRLPEMYYIAAECSDPATATTYLNKVRENRGLKDLDILPDAATAQNEIFKEYQKEFYCEGQLFYYYKRVNATQILYTNTPGTDKVYVLPLPDGEIQFGNR
ncbi:MAG TPA: RagB/SusD family nutrient uptake outer membrane protein [Chitinophaga sp.]